MKSLKVETLKGAELAGAKTRSGRAGRSPTPRSWSSRFLAVEKGQSSRLRISETYTDPGRYLLDGDELVWDRAFGRPRNTVVLPAGWTVVASSIPQSISEDADGAQRLYFENARPDEIQTLIRAVVSDDRADGNGDPMRRVSDACRRARLRDERRRAFQLHSR